VDRDERARSRNLSFEDDSTIETHPTAFADSWSRPASAAPSCTVSGSRRPLAPVFRHAKRRAVVYDCDLADVGGDLWGLA